MLFIQGGGAGTHDEWDDKLVDSLRRDLGDGFDVRYPRMPHEDDPGVATWGPAIREELALLGDGATVVGHSVGGTLLVHELGSHPPKARLGAVMLVATPFVGEGGWPPTTSRSMTGWANGSRPACRCTCSTAWTTTPPRPRTPACTPEPSHGRRSTDCPGATTSSTTTSVRSRG